MIRAVGNHLWQSTLFALAMGALTLGLRKNHAKVRYVLWFIASCKFLFPFSLLISLGSSFQWAHQENFPLARVFATQVPQIVQPMADATPVRTLNPPSPDRTPIGLFAIWGCGFGIVGLIRLRGWLNICAALRSSFPSGIKTPVEVRLSPRLLEPGIIGIVHPILMFPTGIAEGLTAPQLRSLLAHEQCHVQRCDNLLSSIHMIVEAIFWFHPLVWWIGAHLLKEREWACDEEVLRLGNEPLAYAEAILEVCKLCAKSAVLCISGVTGADLKRRVEAILSRRNGEDLNTAQTLLLASAGIAILAVPLAIGLFLSTRDAFASQDQPAVPATLKFDVASIRPCKVPGGLENRVGNSSPGRLGAGCDFLADENNLGFIHRAYVKFAGGHPNPLRIVPIEGGPHWIRTDGYRIDAASEGRPSLEMMQGPMLQALLEERFKLRIHREDKPGPVYSLGLAKGGSKLKPFEEGSCVRLSSPTMSAPPPGQRYCDDMISARTPASIDAEGITLNEFCQLLDLVVDRPVLNNTGLAGKYDIHLSFWRDEFTSRLPPPPVFSPTGPEAGSPTIFSAIQDQLGLRLVPTKGPIEVLVIDHVERPSEN